jgi:hypothetical protein
LFSHKTQVLFSAITFLIYAALKQSNIDRLIDALGPCAPHAGEKLGVLATAKKYFFGLLAAKNGVLATYSRLFG